MTQATIIREATTAVLNWETWQVHQKGCTGNARAYRAAVKGQGAHTTYTSCADATDTITDVLWRDDVMAYIDSCGGYLYEGGEISPKAQLDSFICKCLKDLPWKPEAAQVEAPKATGMKVGNNWGSLKPRF